MPSVVKWLDLPYDSGHSSYYGIGNASFPRAVKHTRKPYYAAWELTDQSQKWIEPAAKALSESMAEMTMDWGRWGSFKYIDRRRDAGWSYYVLVFQSEETAAIVRMAWDGPLSLKKTIMLW